MYIILIKVITKHVLVSKKEAYRLKINGIAIIGLNVKGDNEPIEERIN